MNQKLFELIKKYHVIIHNDKFRDSLIFRPRRGNTCIVWKKGIPIEKRYLINVHRLEYVKFNTSINNGCSISDFTEGLRLIKKEGEVKVYFDLHRTYNHNKQLNELILRVNNEVNYPLKLAYYNITEQIDEGNWLHEWGFELSVELLKELCDADHVCDSWNSDFVWQLNARLIYSVAFVTDQYYDDLISFLNSEEEYFKEEKRKSEERAEEQKRKKEEQKRKAEQKRKEAEQKRKEEEEKKEEEKKEEERKRKKEDIVSEIGFAIMMLGVCVAAIGGFIFLISGFSSFWVLIVGVVLGIMGLIMTLLRLS